MSRSGAKDIQKLDEVQWKEDGEKRWKAKWKASKMESKQDGKQARWKASKMERERTGRETTTTAQHSTACKAQHHQSNPH